MSAMVAACFNEVKAIGKPERLGGDRWSRVADSHPGATVFLRWKLPAADGGCSVRSSGGAATKAKIEHGLK
jgi:hypothetical protein